MHNIHLCCALVGLDNKLYMTLGTYTIIENLLLRCCLDLLYVSTYNIDIHSAHSSLQIKRF